MTAETLTSDIPTAELHQLSDGLAAIYGEAKGDITLYEIVPSGGIGEGEGPMIISRLTSGEIWGLIEFYLDGYCPVCGDSINQGHHLCSTCAAEESRIWAGYGY